MPVALEGHTMLSPSELARLTGVSTDTLRHYERKGVLGIPARSQGGYRLYPPEAVGRVTTGAAGLGDWLYAAGSGGGPVGA